VTSNAASCRSSRQSRHLEEATRGSAAAAAAFFLLDLLTVDLEAALTERDDQLPCSGVIRRRRPVVTAFSARTSLDPVAKLLLHDVEADTAAGPSTRSMRTRRSEERLLVSQYLPVCRSSFQSTPSLPTVNTSLLIPIVDEDALEDDVEVERFGGRMLEVPLQLAVSTSSASVELEYSASSPSTCRG
jgi:hypothetical protein